MTEHYLAKEYGWTHEDIMNLTLHEAAYYLSAIYLEAREMEKARKKAERKVRHHA